VLGNVRRRVKPVMMPMRWNSPARLVSRGYWPELARAMVVSITAAPTLKMAKRWWLAR
jgi:hypothetical protein